jgi:SAM-dependent methyltransferase
VGWTATGIDVDPVAVARAQERGLDVVNCGLSELNAQDRRFDAITISHVIEHVHDPRGLLRDARRLLKPGGYFWIETPNIDAWGHRTFGRHWRDLDPPRHLQIFHLALLKDLLLEAGFDDIKTAPWKSDWGATAETSMELASESGELDGINPGPRPERVGRDHPEKREFITLVATTREHG